MLQNPALKEEFFTRIDSAFVFQKERFLDFLKLRILDSSYTKFANKIGLSLHSDLLKNALLKGQAKVALNFPYKDCVLKGAQSKDSDKSDEIFFNEILASDEIDVLFKPKALCNFEKYAPCHSEGVSPKNPRIASDILLDSSPTAQNDKSGDFDSSPSLKNDKNLKSALQNKPNLLIKGNNLLALHTLKSRRDIYGQVKLIYIDPPYNTGNDSFNYNDRFNHSAWLVFMKNRLEIAREFLREDGVIFIQCDDNEQAYLKVLCDEIFGRENFVACFVCVSAPAGTQSSIFVAQQHSYILCYAKSTNNLIFNRIQKTENELNKKYSEQDEYGFFYAERLWKRGIGGKKEDVPSLHFPVFYDEQNNKIYIDEDSKESKVNLIKIIPYQTAGVLGRWTWSKEKMRNEHYRLIVKKVAGEWKLHKKQYKQDERGVLPNSILGSDIARTEIGSLEIKNVMGAKVFSYPKPEALLKRIIEISTKEGDLVMDFFAGSGTTCAVAHKMNRRWIGIEQMDYVEGITKERLIKVINGEQGGISKAVGWNPLSPSLAEGDKGGGFSSQSKNEASKKDADSTHPLAPLVLREGELPKNAFIYCELMPLNAIYKDKITKSSSESELAQIYDELQTKAFIDYRVDIQEMLKDRDFEALPLADKKKILYAILDSNMDYVAYSDIQDLSFCVDKEVQELNRAFFKGGENG